jgi:hypothetical protein
MHRRLPIDRFLLHSLPHQHLTTVHLPVCTLHAWPNLDLLPSRQTLPTMELAKLCRLQDLRLGLDLTECPPAHLQALHLRLVRHLAPLGPNVSAVVIANSPT